MADFTFDGGRASGWDMDDAAEQTRVTEWLNWAGALLSLVLILGLAAWGWQLMKRDVSGVPVVRALEGPMRVTPDDPGGRLAEHQGLSVNRIAAEGTAEPPVETIVLAPAPLSLTEEDKPAAELAPQPTTPTPASAVASPPDTPAPDAEAANATDMAVAAALASIEAGELDVSSEELVATGPEGGLARSPLPRARPVALTNVSALSSQPDTVAEITPGTRLVQLGAFENAELAEAAWLETETQFADYMAGKTRVIQEAETGGRTFFRLRAAGFADLDDARRFCSVLVSGDLNCIPVVQR